MKKGLLELCSFLLLIRASCRAISLCRSNLFLAPKPLDRVTYFDESVIPEGHGLNQYSLNNSELKDVFLKHFEEAFDLVSEIGKEQSYVTGFHSLCLCKPL